MKHSLFLRITAFVTLSLFLCSPMVFAGSQSSSKQCIAVNSFLKDKLDAKSANQRDQREGAFRRAVRTRLAANDNLALAAGGLSQTQVAITQLTLWLKKEGDSSGRLQDEIVTLHDHITEGGAPRVVRFSGVRDSEAKRAAAEWIKGKEVSGNNAAVLPTIRLKLPMLGEQSAGVSHVLFILSQSELPEDVTRFFAYATWLMEELLVGRTLQEDFKALDARLRETYGVGIRLDMRLVPEVRGIFYRENIADTPPRPHFLELDYATQTIVVTPRAVYRPAAITANILEFLQLTRIMPLMGADPARDLPQGYQIQREALTIEAGFFLLEVLFKQGRERAVALLDAQGDGAGMASSSIVDLIAQYREQEKLGSIDTNSIDSEQSWANYVGDEADQALFLEFVQGELGIELSLQQIYDAEKMTVQQLSDLMDVNTQGDGVAQEITSQRLASLFDHTNLDSSATKGQIQVTAREAKEKGFALVAVRPGDPSLWAAEVLQGSKAGVGPAIGFRNLTVKYDGSNMTRAQALARYDIPLDEKEEEIRSTLRALHSQYPDMRYEIDFVINVKRLLDGDQEYVKDEIQRLVALSREVASQGRGSEPVIVKVIGENAFLSDAQMRFVYQAALEAGADFVKTSTGYAPVGATVHHLQLMRKIVGPDMGIKAAGGVRSVEDALAMIEAVSPREVTPSNIRLGSSSSVSILVDYQTKKRVLGDGVAEQDGPAEFSKLAALTAIGRIVRIAIKEAASVGSFINPDELDPLLRLHHFLTTDGQIRRFRTRLERNDVVGEYARLVFSDIPESDMGDLRPHHLIMSLYGKHEKAIERARQEEERRLDIALASEGDGISEPDFSYRNADDVIQSVQTSVAANNDPSVMPSGDGFVPPSRPYTATADTRFRRTSASLETSFITFASFDRIPSIHPNISQIFLSREDGVESHVEGNLLVLAQEDWQVQQEGPLVVDVTRVVQQAKVRGFAFHVLYLNDKDPGQIHAEREGVTLFRITTFIYDFINQVVDSHPILKTQTELLELLAKALGRHA